MPDDLIAERDAIVAELTRLAQTVTEEELRGIAAAERHGVGDGDPFDRHLGALRDVIFQQACRTTDEQYWFPLEAIELAAYVPGRHATRVFEISTAILLIEALYSEDGMGHMEGRWRMFGLDNPYLRMNEPFRQPILLGFRWLQDAIPDWNEFKEYSNNEPISIPTRQEVQAM